MKINENIINQPYYRGGNDLNMLALQDIKSLPVTLKLFDKEDVMMVRFCIPGNVAIDMCLSSSKVICSYTYEVIRCFSY